YFRLWRDKGRRGGHIWSLEYIGNETYILKFTTSDYEGSDRRTLSIYNGVNNDKIKSSEIEEIALYKGHIDLKVNAAGIKISENFLEDNNDYTLSYKIKKTEGNIKTLGGHFIVGKNIDTKIFDENNSEVSLKGNYIQGLTFPNDDKIYKVVIKFSTKTLDPPDDNNLYIQPNRTKYEDIYTAEVWDIQLKKGREYTEWKPCLEDDRFKRSEYDRLNMVLLGEDSVYKTYRNDESNNELLRDMKEGNYGKNEIKLLGNMVNEKQWKNSYLP